MKKPIEPTKPIEPIKFSELTELIYITDGDTTLSGLLNKAKNSVRKQYSGQFWEVESISDEWTFDSFTMEGEDLSDNAFGGGYFSSVLFKWKNGKIVLRNKKYESQLKDYNKKLKIYQKKYEDYQKALKEYNEYHEPINKKKIESKKKFLQKQIETLTKELKKYE